MALRRFGPEMDGGLLPAPQVPAEEQDVSALLLRQLFGLMGDRRAGADREAASAREALQTAEATPAQTINPLAEGAARGLARVGNVLSRGKSGGGIGGEIAARKSAFEMARKDNLNRLRQTYEAAAERAMQMGDTETETKVRVAIHKLDQQYKDERAEESETLRRDLADQTDTRFRDLADKTDARLRDLADAGAIDKQELARLRHDLELAEIRLRADLRPPTAAEAKQEEAKGPITRDLYVKERTKLVQAAISKKGKDRDAAMQAIKVHDMQRIAGETVEQFRARLTAARKTKKRFGEKDYAPLFSEAEAGQAAALVFTPEELQEAAARARGE